MTLRRLPLRRSLREKKPGCHASAEKPGRGTDELGSAVPVAKGSKALLRRTPRVIVGTAVLAAIETAKINGGILGSGAALITHTLDRMMFNRPIPEANASYLLKPAKPCSAEERSLGFCS